MKHVFYKLILVASLATFLMGTLSAQDKPTYVQVLYIDAYPGKGGDYREFVLDKGVKMAQARADAGVHSAWYFMRARVPSGKRANADYLIVNVMADGFDSPSMGAAEVLQKAGLQMSSDEYWETIFDSVQLLYTDIWSTVAQVSNSEVGNYILINYMDVHDMNDWLEIENDIVTPVMEARVKDGDLAGWGAYRLFLPRGRDLAYNAGTVDVFEDWAAIGKRGRFVEYIEKTHPNVKWSELGPRIGATRDIVRSDLYEVLAKVTPSETTRIAQASK